MLQNLIKKWWFKWLVLGLAVRVILMPITLHQDLWGHSSVAYFFSEKGILNPYEYLSNLSPDHPLVKNIGVSDVFIYPPLAYFTLGVFRILVKPFTDPGFVPFIWSNLASVYSFPGFNWHLFLYKFPYLFFDIGIAFLLSSLFSEERKKQLVFILWMLNPVTLYTTFMIGQLDLLPTFFTVLSLVLAKKGKFAWSMISLGVGGSYKIFPLLFVPVAAFVFGKNFKEKVMYLLVGVAPFILVTLPYITSLAYREMVLFSPKNQKMLFMNLPVSGAEGIFTFVFILTLIYFYSYYTKKVINLGVYFLTILLLIFSVTHYHPQWFLWVTPFLFWELSESNFKHGILVLTLFLAWLAITLFFETSLTIGLFSPLNASLRDLRNLPGLSEVLSRYTDVFRLKSLIRSVFAAASLFYIYRLYKLRGVVK